MTDHTTRNVWPLPKFYFEMEMSGVGKIPFQEVSGLDNEAQPIEYRAGDSKVFSTVKMPGMVNQGIVTMKKGVFVNDNKFWDMFNQIQMNTIERVAVTIRLLDEMADPKMIWTLDNAFPTKISGTDLKSDGNEVAVEALEIAYERLTIENAR